MHPYFIQIKRYVQKATCETLSLLHCVVNEHVFRFGFCFLIYSNLNFMFPEDVIQLGNN